MKLLRTICVLGLTLCLATSVYAGTQSVKLSGDLTVRSIMRDDYDLDHNSEEVPTGAVNVMRGETRIGNSSNWQNYVMSTAEVQLDADLTDNVSAVLRVFNQRDWNVSAKAIQVNTPLTALGRNGYAQDASEFDIGLDLAYVELKEFLYSPLTLKIGRQDLWFGKGLIVGANLQDYNANIHADEYTCVSSFDALRATLDYDPWTIDGIAAVIWENDIQSDDDTQLYGLNLGYLFDTYNAEAEAYWFNKRDDSIETWNIKQGNIVHTLGIRGSGDPIENLTVAAEFAKQFGNFTGFRNQTEARGRTGWAVDAGVESRHFKEQYAWKPVIGTEYIFYSGDRHSLANPDTAGNYTGWDPMYRGKFDTAYREFVGKYNVTHQGFIGQRTNYVDNFPDASYNNQHQAIVYSSLQPTDSLTLDARYAVFWQHHQREYDDQDLDGMSHSLTDKRKRFIGQEIDVTLTWDYTEDVSFGLLAAWFFPGDHYYDASDDTAQDIVGTVKLSF